jgi:hypothetical protein
MFQRTSTAVTPRFNAITNEQWSKDVPEHAHWRKIFFVQESTAKWAEYDNLSDLRRIEDLAEDTNQFFHELADNVAYDETNAKDFGYILTDNYAKKIQFIHTLIHFGEYVNNYVLQVIAPKEGEKPISVDDSWESAWEQLMTPTYANVSIESYSKIQKKVLDSQDASLCKVIVHLWETLLLAEKLCSDAKLAMQ